MKATARPSVPNVAPEPFEEPGDVATPSDISEFADQSSAAAGGRASFAVSLPDRGSRRFERQSSADYLPCFPLRDLTRPPAQLARLPQSGRAAIFARYEPSYN